MIKSTYAESIFTGKQIIICNTIHSRFRYSPLVAKLIYFILIGYLLDYYIAKLRKQY